MKQALDLETPDRVPDDMGGHRVVWRLLGRLWAVMEASPAREVRGEVATESPVRWRITVPGAPAGDPRRPRPGQRLRMGARIFAIEAVSEADLLGRQLRVWAREEEGRL